jgi:hypothetical protein
MKLDAKAGRGTMIKAYCRQRKLAAFQWCDSKVVNCVSTYLDMSTTQVKRQVGAEKKQFDCPSALRHYQENMGGVDKGDQVRGHFGGFAAQSHFKKWYKKTLMAILDCMLLNGINLWNMSCDRVPTRKRLLRFQFLHVVANELLNHYTETICSPENTPARAQGAAPLNDGMAEHEHHTYVNAVGKHRCVVCRLEESQYQYIMKKNQGNHVSDITKDKLKEVRKGVKARMCLCRQCGVYCHNFLPEDDTKIIHGLFPGLTCMEILHSNRGREIWNVRNTAGNRKVWVNYNHRDVKEIRRAVEAHFGNHDDA